MYMVLIEVLVFSYFVFVVAYSLTFSFAGLFYSPPSFLNKKQNLFNKIGVIIPSYKEDGVIVKVASQALNQNYDKSHYDVIVVADSLQKSTLDELAKINIILHEVHFEKSTKVRSIQSVLAKYRDYEIIVILDADNVMATDFLEKINSCFNNNWKAVQGQRVAKNKNTSFAILDGLSEAIGNHINRSGAIALGLSSPIIGSGMAFSYTLLNDIMNSIDSVGGFDKELQIKVLQRGERILYLKNAIVQDEKVDNPQVFENQRKRWMSSHYIYAKKFLKTGMLSFFEGKFSLFNIAVLLSVQLPRIMNLGLLFLITFLSVVIHSFFNLPIWCWPLLLLSYLLSLAIAIPSKFYNKKFLIALLQVPKAFFTILFLHFKLKGADKKFIHTPHKQQ